MSERKSLRDELLKQELWSSDEVSEYLQLSGLDAAKVRAEGFPQPSHQEGRTWWVRDDVVVWCKDAGGSA